MRDRLGDLVHQKGVGQSHRSRELGSASGWNQRNRSQATMTLQAAYGIPMGKKRLSTVDGAGDRKHAHFKSKVEGRWSSPLVTER